MYIKGNSKTDKSEILADGNIWAEAAGQIFFSLGVCMGVMTSYGSYRDTKNPVVANSLIVSLVNSGVSFLSGFVVWSTIGYLRHINSDVSDKTSSIGLAFIAYPTAVSKIEIATFWNLLLFLIIFLLGIASAFSLLEAMSTVVHDFVGNKIGRPIITLIITIACAATSIIYCLDIGLYLFDTVDHYINNYVMLALGAFECIGLSWFY